MLLCFRHTSPFLQCLETFLYWEETEERREEVVLSGLTEREYNLTFTVSGLGGGAESDKMLESSGALAAVCRFSTSALCAHPLKLFQLLGIDILHCGVNLLTGQMSYVLADITCGSNR